MSMEITLLVMVITVAINCAAFLLVLRALYPNWKDILLSILAVALLVVASALAFKTVSYTIQMVKHDEISYTSFPTFAK